MQTGSLDYSTQSHCSGWAVENGQPAIPHVFVNGQRVSSRWMEVDRPDLAAHGLPARAGFLLKHPEPLGLDDTLDLRFPNGDPVPNSPSVQHRDRLVTLLHGIPPGGRGLEFGVLDRPILSKRKYNVRYVDHASRGDLVRKYGVTTATLNIDPADIKDVDVVWPGGDLVAIAGSGYEYCLASHVIEHVADPITWLNNIALCLRPGGRLNLAIPEMTRTFDRCRAPSTPAMMLDAHRLKLTRPSFVQVFDHVLGATPVTAPPPDRQALAAPAYATATRVAQTEEYIDVHCHVWSHTTFGECWQVIAALGLLPLSLDQLIPPQGDYNEFTALFTRI